MSNICIIPARSGSKRIPLKNIKLFLGRPIISYSIEAAISSKLFDVVMVSTEDKDIAIIAKKYGATVPFYRSAENSNDNATTFDVINEVINHYKELNLNFTHICCLYPCAPFVNNRILSESFDIFKKTNYDSIIPIVPFSYPIQRAIKVNKDKTISFLNPIYKNSKSQELKIKYHDSGQFYWLNKNALIKKEILTDNTGFFELNPMYTHDIDTIEDWEMAEFKFKLLLENKKKVND